jgi:hypothetical protein
MPKALMVDPAEERKPAVLVEAEFSAKEIEEIVFPHPTVSALIRDSILTMP